MLHLFLQSDSTICSSLSPASISSPPRCYSHSKLLHLPITLLTWITHHLPASVTIPTVPSFIFLSLLPPHLNPPITSQPLLLHLLSPLPSASGCSPSGPIHHRPASATTPPLPSSICLWLLSIRTHPSPPSLCYYTSSPLFHLPLAALHPDPSITAQALLQFPLSSSPSAHHPSSSGSTRHLPASITILTLLSSICPSALLIWIHPPPPSVYHYSHSPFLYLPISPPHLDPPATSQRLSLFSLSFPLSAHQPSSSGSTRHLPASITILTLLSSICPSALLSWIHSSPPCSCSTPPLHLSIQNANCPFPSIDAARPAGFLLQNPMSAVSCVSTLISQVEI
ncbi:proline-rich protein 36-like [Hypanus sabinus]|uniref:proline-rich protein 36-like n=1 Tax=Hypanus sabinus TaxID=79690 RepID=UPI0028C39606|nr:proline-rich protein 36-like [Hypanus sabinus]XP_059832124.1 proline-rich protein 36-like [Hypanus sabinus]